MFRTICIIVGLLFIISAFAFLFFAKEDRQEKKKILKNGSGSILRQLLYVVISFIR